MVSLQRPCMANITSALDAAVQQPQATFAFYSQQCEDRFFHTYFMEGNHHPVHHRVRTYVELGANNGVSMSNTRGLYSLGWRGLLVEATPTLCDELKINRPGDVVVCGAVCDASFGGELTFTATGHAKGGLIGHSVAMGTVPAWSQRMGRNQN